MDVKAEAMHQYGRNGEMTDILEKNVREFCEKEISPLAQEIDSRDEIPKHVYQKMKDQGLMTLILPQEYGGLGLSYGEYSKVIRIVSEYSAGISLSLEAHNSLGMAQIIKYSSEELKQKAMRAVFENSSPIAWALTEPRGGSDAKGMASTAERDKEGFIIKGTKTFITHGYTADMIVTFAKTEKGVTAFLVEGNSKGLKRSKLEGKLGTRGPDTATLVFDDVYVPAENVIRKEAAMAKYFSSQVAMQAARTAVQFLGGYGYFRGTSAERMYRDAKLLEIGEGTNEVLKMIIAKEIIG